MLRVFTLLFVCCNLLIASANISQSNVQDLFESWRQQHNKAYNMSESPMEYQHRMLIFQNSLQFIAKHNEEARRGLHSFTVGLNHFADLTLDEFRSQYLSKRFSTNSNNNNTRFGNPIDLPTSIDWRTKGVVTPVRNEGQCGGSLDIAVDENLESVHAYKTGKLIPLSASQLADCANAQDLAGTFAYAVANGLESETAYPVSTGCPSGTCSYNSSLVVARFSSYVQVTSGDENSLQAAVATAPCVAAAVEADSSAFMFYASGVFDDPSCGQQVDHAVSIAGYGVSSNVDYWIVKNSWGTSWGMDGYILIARNKNNMCGIATDAAYAISA